MSNLPSNELTKKAIQYFIDYFKANSIPIVNKNDLLSFLNINETDYRILERYFHNLIFKRFGSDRIQIDRDILKYENRMSHCSFNDALQFFRSQKSSQRNRYIYAILAAKKKVDIPAITIRAILTLGRKTDEGVIVEAVSTPWFEIMEIIKNNPESIYDISCWDWEEIIAGAYKKQGFDEVILTPRSGDKGRDIIASRNDGFSIRIFDQVKAYKPGHLVPANDVRALLGVLSGAQNVSKGIITTTSDFAPKVESDDYIKPFIPYKLDLRPKDKLLPWLESLCAYDNDDA